MNWSTIEDMPAGAMLTLRRPSNNAVPGLSPELESDHYTRRLSNVAAVSATAAHYLIPHHIIPFVGGWLDNSAAFRGPHRLWAHVSRDLNEHQAGPLDMAKGLAVLLRHYGHQEPVVDGDQIEATLDYILPKALLSVIITDGAAQISFLSPDAELRHAYRFEHSDWRMELESDLLYFASKLNRYRIE